MSGISGMIGTTLVSRAKTESTTREAATRLLTRSLLPPRPRLHIMACICILLACVGSCWFSYQSLLVPQPARYTPDWRGAQWIEASDGLAPVAYFHYGTSLGSLPDNAFVTIAASQVFTLYVNGNFIGSNASDFVDGNANQAYMYDVTSSLHAGTNTMAVRVANLDEQVPSLRMSMGVVTGSTVSFYGTGLHWQATMQSIYVYPRYSTTIHDWSSKTFLDTSWPGAMVAPTISTQSYLSVNPLVYEQSLSAHWMSAGAGRDAYFVRQLSLPLGANAVWLRIAATGTATVFINGKLAIIWNGQLHTTGVSEIGYLSYSEPRAPVQKGLALGTYDISPYLHMGTNTLAVYVASPGLTATRLGLEDLSAAAIVDVLAGDIWGHTSLFSAVSDWHASHTFVNGWYEGSAQALAWAVPTEVGRRGSLRTFYRPNSNNLLSANTNSRGEQVVPLTSSAEVLAAGVALVLVPWLLLSLVSTRRRVFPTMRLALETLSLAYLPALAAEMLLITLAREPQMPQPFPYTWAWGLALIAFVVAGYALLWQNRIEQMLLTYLERERARRIVFPIKFKLPQLLSRYSWLFSWLRVHWPLVLIFLVAVPMISYNLAYEPVWQDELSSYYTAKDILVHGLPLFPSGFVYAKAELYSYLLALWMFLFGDSVTAARSVSVLEYLISIPLLYYIGRYFFERYTALLATAMLAFSPVTLIWGRQIRMYEQAQVFTLLTLYLLCRAVEERSRTRLVYLAVGSVVLTYLSHEETFIILPALVICTLMLSRKLADSKERILRLPSILFQKQWWYAALLGGSIIGVQLLIVHFTHPPVLGTDQSERPMVQLTTDNIPYYMTLLFTSTKHETWLVLNSLLATLGCWWARKSESPRIRFCALFLVLSFLTLIFLFTMQADRYFYPLLPMYYLMGAFTVVTALQACWKFAHARVVRNPVEHTSSFMLGDYLTSPMRTMIGMTLTLLVACILIAPMLPVGGYNLFLSRVTGLSYHRHYPDYDAVGQYMQQHWQPGDAVLCVSPDFSVQYYVGHADAFFSIDRALFIFERDGHIVGTSVGAQALFNQNDLDAFLSAHKRVWMISSNSFYQAQVEKRFTFPPDMHIVFEGYGSAVYLRDG